MIDGNASPGRRPSPAVPPPPRSLRSSPTDERQSGSVAALQRPDSFAAADLDERISRQNDETPQESVGITSELLPAGVPQQVEPGYAIHPAIGEEGEQGSQLAKVEESTQHVAPSTTPVKLGSVPTETVKDNSEQTGTSPRPHDDNGRDAVMLRQEGESLPRKSASFVHEVAETPDGHPFYFADDDRDELDLLAASQVEPWQAVGSSPPAIPLSLTQSTVPLEQDDSPPPSPLSGQLQDSPKESEGRALLPAISPTVIPTSDQPTSEFTGAQARYIDQQAAEGQNTPMEEVPPELLQPSPPRRALRSRKPGQLNPYTIEMAMYKRRLERNDWEDAVVTDAQFRRRMREERERAAADVLPVDQGDWQLQEAEAEQRRERRRIRKAEAAKQKEALRAVDSGNPTEGDRRSAPAAHKGGSKRRRVTPQQTINREALFAPFGGVLSEDEADEEQIPVRQQSGKRTYSGKRGGRRATHAGSEERDTESSGSEDAPRPAGLPRRTQFRRINSTGAVNISTSSDEDTAQSERASRVVGVGGSESESSSSSEESVDYDRYFRQLKRMMPLHMARKHIEDLKNMRKGKAYHSDGHVSSTPEPSLAGSGSESDAGHPATTPATSPMTSHELRPGETRKRIRPHGEGEGTGPDARFDLLGDDASDASGGGLSVASIHSSSSAQSRYGGGQDADIRWWARPEPPRLTSARTRRSDIDDVDRMLSRSTTNRPRVRQARLSDAHRRSKDPHASRARPSTSRADVSTRTPLRDRAVNSLGSNLRKSTTKRKRYGPQHSRLPPRILGSNPPIVHPRVRRRLDLLDDDILFDVEILRSEPLSRAEEEEPDERALEESQKAIASYRAINRPNRPIVRRNGQLEQYRVPNPNELLDRNDAAVVRTERTFDLINSRRVVTGTDSDVHHVGRSLAERPLHHGRLVQQRLDAHGTLRRQAVADPKSPTPSAHQLDANAWADLANLRLDFGIRPLAAGLSFSPNSQLGRGRLFELITLPGEQDIASEAWTRLRAVHVFGLNLPASTDPDSLFDLLPTIFDAIYAATESLALEDADTSRVRSSVDELLRYIALALSAFLRVLPWRQVRQVTVAVQSQMDHLFDRFQTAGIGSSEEVGGTSQQSIASLILALRWFNVEICWRSIASQRSAELDSDECIAEEEDFVLACQGVMVSLLSHGLHQTMSNVKRICQPSLCRTEGNMEADRQQYVDDYSAEIWVSLIHVLAAASTVLGPHAAFWPVFEAALAQWKATLPPRRKVLTAEMIWYAILSLCALSQFSASTGTTGSTSSLTQHWPLVVQALTATKLRYEETVEQAMPSAAVSKRDQYIRAIVQRCFNLSSLWKWSMDGADSALSKLFDIFNDHKLADLPSEEDHDFPPFLREYDARLLFDESKREATTYHIFLKLLARAAKDLHATAKDTRDAERRVARLFSRVSPVRVMSFTRTSPPTSRERSSLFNHYAVVMLHLYLMPSAAPQRLRQVKSFLVFKDADAQSQVSCIRAMLYAAVIFRHYDVDISPIATWFSTILKALLVDAEEVNRLSGKKEPGSHFESLRQARRVNGLLVTSLRSVQHIIEHTGLRQEDGSLRQPSDSRSIFPDIQLLDRAWTSDILESQTAIDPAVGMEVLKCIQVCLLQRNNCMDSISERRSNSLAHNSSRQHVTTSRTEEGESQDSFADLLLGDEVDDSFDFTDPALDDMLGDNAAAAAREERLVSLRAADLKFAHHLRDNISPSFFRLISNIYHPDRQSEGRRISLGLSDALRDSGDHSGGGGRQHLENLLKRTTRRRYLELLIDCWAGCANVLVQNGLRDWNSYLTYGNESWKRIVDATGKRDVGLRFLQNVAVLDPSSYHSHKTEFLQVWFQAAAARSLSVQADFTRTLFEEIDPEMQWLRGALAQIRNEESGRGGHGSLTLDTFQQHRSLLITSAVEEMARDFQEFHRPGANQRRPMIFSCLSGFLSAMRAHLENLPPRRDPATAVSIDRYLAFCRDSTRAISTKAGEMILRGVRGEVERTVALIDRIAEVGAMPVTTALGF